MVKNNINKLTNRSGRKTHRYLMQEAYRVFQSRGYKIEVEKKLKRGIADLLVTKGNEQIIIECLVRPTLGVVKEKIKIYSGYNIIFVYPSVFVPNFPIDNFGKEVIKVEVPEKYIIKKKTVNISDELWYELTQRKEVGESFDSLVNRLLLELPPLKAKRAKKK